jgi:hypothetical protein
VLRQVDTLTSYGLGALLDAVDAVRDLVSATGPDGSDVLELRLVITGTGASFPAS